MTHSFANVLYLYTCMLGNCSCFYFRLLTFFKIKLFKNKPPITIIRVSDSFDPDQDRHSVGLHLGSNSPKSPQNHFITKHILFLKQFHQLS